MFQHLLQLVDHALIPQDLLILRFSLLLRYVDKWRLLLLLINGCPGPTCGASTSPQLSSLLSEVLLLIDIIMIVHVQGLINAVLLLLAVHQTLVELDLLLDLCVLFFVLHELPHKEFSVILLGFVFVSEFLVLL
jgi:hypothetical protein